MLNLAIVSVERTFTTHEAVATIDGTDFSPIWPVTNWDTEPYLGDVDGMRLIEEIGRRVRSTAVSTGHEPDAVAVVMPGTIHQNSIIGRSTRLNIRTRVDLAENMMRLHGLRAAVFHDAHAIAIGEAMLLGPGHPAGMTPNSENFAYVLVDEGVGMSLFIDGIPQRGAGSAGALGRLVVEPTGEYNKAFAARGTLEVYAARPSISKHIVAEYLAEQDKQTQLDATDTPFRRQVNAAARSERWQSLTVPQIAAAIRSNEQIALRVIDDAARYLAMALNAVITIANPPLIILGGSLIEGLPGFGTTIISHVRRLSWGAAWNRTTILLSQDGRSARTRGAARLLHQIMTTS